MVCGLWRCIIGENSGPKMQFGCNTNNPARSGEGLAAMQQLEIDQGYCSKKSGGKFRIFFGTLGIGPQEGGEHAAQGTHNRVLRLGECCYLEVIAKFVSKQSC
jgi:hypothetical protein